MDVKKEITFVCGGKNKDGENLCTNGANLYYDKFYSNTELQEATEKESVSLDVVKAFISNMTPGAIYKMEVKLTEIDTY